jgi:hypothetical protein
MKGAFFRGHQFDLHPSDHVKSLHASWSDMLDVHCPLCGAVRETLIDSALHDATDRSQQAV